MGRKSSVFISVLTAIFIRELISLSISNSLIFGLGISVFAFTGDVLASYIKRKLEIKDFSKLIPGHGGVLDRFDSLIFASVFIVSVSSYIV